jgi:hypothetical protein
MTSVHVRTRADDLPHSTRSGVASGEVLRRDLVEELLELLDHH